MQGDGNAATVMLGLPGFVLLAVSELGSEIEYAIETSEAVIGCPDCGVLARLHDRRRSDVGDLPAGGRAVTLAWIRRVWRCMEPRPPRAPSTYMLVRSTTPIGRPRSDCYSASAPAPEDRRRLIFDDSRRDRRTMKFTRTAQLADAPDLVMVRLLEGASDTSAWELADDGRQVRLRAEGAVGRSSGRVNTETVVTVEPSQPGTKLTMTATLTISRRAELLLRPWAAHRVRELFAQLVRSLETGAPMSRDENWRAGARLKIRIRTVALTIQLLLGAVVVAFFALVAWPIAVLSAVMFVLVAIRPLRRLAAARDTIAKPLGGDRPVNTDEHA